MRKIPVILKEKFYQQKFYSFPLQISKTNDLKLIRQPYFLQFFKLFYPTVVLIAGYANRWKYVDLSGTVQLTPEWDEAYFRTRQDR